MFRRMGVLDHFYDAWHWRVFWTSVHGVMRSSGHISLELTLEGPEYVLHHRLRLHNGSVLSSASHIILLTYHQHSMGPFGIYTEHPLL
jgi:hypothetical protein